MNARPIESIPTPELLAQIALLESPAYLNLSRIHAEYLRDLKTEQKTRK